MSGFDQSSIAVSMPTVVGADAALGGPYKIKPSEAFSGALMTVSGLTGETISVETSPDGYWGAPASPTFYRTDWQGRQRMYSTPRTNRALQSQSLDNATWPKRAMHSVTADQTTAPDGTVTADLVSATGGNSANQGVYQNDATSGNGTYTASIWLKAGSSSSVQMCIKDAGTDTVRATVTVPLTASWQRFSVTGTTVAGGGFRFELNTTATGDFYAWGAQIEAGSTPTAYIPTTTVAVSVTDYTISNGVITLAEAPVTGATLSYDNSVLPSPYYIFATGDGVRTQFAYDGVWGTLSANSGKGNGIWQVDLRGAQAYRLVKSAGSETATVNMILKRDALQYKNTAGTWSVT